jgi:hypothetical protein
VPSVLTTADRDKLRALTVGFFADSCQVIAVTYSGGGPSAGRSEGAPGAAVPCRLRTTGFNPTEREIASRIQTGTTYAVDLPVGTAVKGKDILLVSGSRRLRCGRSHPRRFRGDVHNRDVRRARIAP